MEYSTGESGIKSLGGFAYQIKVFTYYLSKLQQNEQIEFETIEDVNIRTFQKQDIDNKGDDYKCILKKQQANVAIQVKRTKISNKSSEKILYNWLIIEKGSNNVGKYVLFSDELYENQDIIFNRDINDLFNKIRDSNNNANALITRVRELFQEFEEFQMVYNQIKSKYEFKSMYQIDEQIVNGYSTIFRRLAVSETIYYMRIQELLRYITMKIMQAVSKGQPFICTFTEFISQVEEICKNIEENQVVLSYSTFKSSSVINWEDLKIVNSRECIQLNSCNIHQRIIEEHLIYKLYYESLRCLYMENNKIQKIDDIENTTYDNYVFSKAVLQQDDRDTPLNRLSDTKKASNSYTPNDQIRYGVAIYLTRNDIEVDKQISWKEDL